MAIPVEMPKMSDTMEEGVLVEWQVEEGAAVSAGDIIAQVETDKATMDLEVYDDGVLLKKLVAEGDAIPIGGLIAVLGSAGENVDAILAKYANGNSAAGASPSIVEDVTDSSPKAETVSGDGAVAEVASGVVAGDSGRVLSSPLARRLANDNNVSLVGLAGSGPRGRIVKRDVEAALANGSSAMGVAQGLPVEQAPEIVKLSQMRKAIARRLASSKFSSPHFYLTIDVDMVNAVSFRSQANANVEETGNPKISFNDMITKACALALLAHPVVNSTFNEEEGQIEYHKNAHVAIAVAIEDGLITPVIRHAGHKTLRQIATETRQLAGKARNKKLQPDEYAGSTFTTSNLGMFGIDEFTAIINPPNSCILAIGSIRDVPVVTNGEVVPGKQMKLTMSCDHRSVDGASGAQFLATVRQYLEQPVQMVL